MQIEGTLAKWNDERGFGFIAPRLGGQEVFVHVSSFPRDGRRPRIGEALWFDLEVDASGRKRAVRVVRPTRAAMPAARPPARASQAREPGSRSGRVFTALVVIAVVAGIGVMTAKMKRAEEPMSFAAPASAPAPSPANPGFKCDGRTHCSQMTSCAEATFFLRNCPTTKMDGDRDGIPCEEQWCSHPLAR